MRLAALQRADAGLQDRLGRGEIRLADAQRDDILHRGDDIKEFADAGGLERGYPVWRDSFWS